jgi:hypothetical protein
LLFADKLFALSSPLKGATGSKRDHYQKAWDATGVKPKELELPEFPETMRYIWKCYESLRRGRQYCEFGLLPFCWSDIKSWAELMGEMLTPNDVDILKQIDDIELKKRD